jgi:protein-tyrosine phosphatase
MVDIHCHILPGLDDGAESWEVSLQMAEMAIADGITHIVATPHANSNYKFDPERIRQLRDELQAKLGDRLTLTTGCDFHLSYENLQDARLHPQKYTLNQKNYLLVEFADYSIPPTIDDTLHQLQLLGMRPIITHPERNPIIRATPQKLEKWLERGCYAQITALSLVGRFGAAAKHAAERWLEEDRIHFVASDAHNLSGRPLRLRQAFDVVVERKGEAVARALFVENPLAAVEGRALPYVPEPAGSGERTSSRRRKRFIFF